MLKVIASLAGALLMASSQLALAQAAVSEVELENCGVYGPDNRLIRETTRIAAQIGTRFGCQVSLLGSPEGASAEFRAVVRFPSMPGASGDFSSSQSRPIGAPGIFVGYTFRKEMFLVRGTWHLEIWVKGKKLAEREFAVEPGG